MSMVLLIGCGLVLLLLVGAMVGVGLALLMQGGDAVSTAREDWLHRRSEKDQEGW